MALYTAPTDNYRKVTPTDAEYISDLPSVIDDTTDLIGYRNFPVGTTSLFSGRGVFEYLNTASDRFIRQQLSRFYGCDNLIDNGRILINIPESLGQLSLVGSSLCGITTETTNSLVPFSRVLSFIVENPIITQTEHWIYDPTVVAGQELDDGLYVPEPPDPDPPDPDPDPEPYTGLVFGSRSGDLQDSSNDTFDEIDPISLDEQVRNIAVNGTNQLVMVTERVTLTQPPPPIDGVCGTDKFTCSVGTLSNPVTTPITVGETVTYTAPTDNYRKVTPDDPEYIADLPDSIDGSTTLIGYINIDISNVGTTTFGTPEKYTNDSNDDRTARTLHLRLYGCSITLPNTYVLLKNPELGVQSPPFVSETICTGTMQEFTSDAYNNAFNAQGIKEFLTEDNNGVVEHWKHDPTVVAGQEIAEGEAPVPALEHTWICKGIRGGADSPSCSVIEALPPPPPTPVNGECGTDKFTCTAGTLADTSESDRTATWTCQGLNGGTDDTCTIDIPVDGVCGTEVNTCDVGALSNQIDGEFSWDWTCLGINGGRDDTCSINKPIPPETTTPTPLIPSVINIQEITNSSTNYAQWDIVWDDPEGFDPEIMDYSLDYQYRAEKMDGTFETGGGSRNASSPLRELLRNNNVDLPKVYKNYSFRYRLEIRTATDQGIGVNGEFSSYYRVWSATPQPPQIHGQCGITKNSCIIGTLSNPTEDELQETATWTCLGQFGGRNDTCTISIPVDGVCGSEAFTCDAGTLSNVDDSECRQSWVCLGRNGGSNDTCVINKPGTSGMFNTSVMTDNQLRIFGYQNGEDIRIFDEYAHAREAVYERFQQSGDICLGGISPTNVRSRDLAFNSSGVREFRIDFNCPGSCGGANKIGRMYALYHGTPPIIIPPPPLPVITSAGQCTVDDSGLYSSTRNNVGGRSINLFKGCQNNGLIYKEEERTGNHVNFIISKYPPRDTSISQFFPIIIAIIFENQDSGKGATFESTAPTPLNPTPPVSVSNSRYRYVNVSVSGNQLNTGSSRYILHPEAWVDYYFSEEFTIYLRLSPTVGGDVLPAIGMTRRYDGLDVESPDSSSVLRPYYNIRSQDPYNFDTSIKLGAVNEDGISILQINSSNILVARFTSSGVELEVVQTTAFSSRGITYIPASCGKTLFGVSISGQLYDIAVVYSNSSYSFGFKTSSLNSLYPNESFVRNDNRSIVGTIKDGTKNILLKAPLFGIFGVTQRRLRGIALEPDLYRSL